ncbi:MAG: hypothetical protein ACRCTJ_03470, partial [Brevinema sp.]
MNYQTLLLFLTIFLLSMFPSQNYKASEKVAKEIIIPCIELCPSSKDGLSRSWDVYQQISLSLITNKAQDQLLSIFYIRHTQDPYMKREFGTIIREFADDVPPMLKTFYNDVINSPEFQAYVGTVPSTEKLFGFYQIKGSYDYMFVLGQLKISLTFQMIANGNHRRFIPTGDAALKFPDLSFDIPQSYIDSPGFNTI